MELKINKKTARALRGYNDIQLSTPAFVFVTGATTDPLTSFRIVGLIDAR